MGATVGYMGTTADLYLTPFYSPFTKGDKNWCIWGGTKLWGTPFIKRGTSVGANKGEHFYSLASLFKGRWRGKLAAPVGYMWQRFAIVPPLLKGGRADEYL